MAKFIMLYCKNDPETFCGYYRIHIEADDLDAAEKQGQFILSQGIQKIEYEYSIIEVGDGHWNRVWDCTSKPHKRG